MTSVAVNGILVLALLVFAGGIMGFVKAKSKASLIAGSASAVLLCVCYYVSTGNVFNGIIAAAVVTALLEVIFIVRLLKTKKFMPSGLMLILCIIEQLLLALSLFTGTK